MRTFVADRALELLAVLVVVTGLIGLTAALLRVFHAPQVWLMGMLATGAYAALTRGPPIDAPARASAGHLLLILLVALFFRVPAYNYVLGGQDEGVYVNMANNLARTGSVAPTDPVRLALNDPAAAARYLQDNYNPSNYLPGVYRTPGDLPRLVFQFYHLFPVWMALFGGVFGAPGSVYALTFLALVSIVFFYRLALALTDSRPGALIAGLLLGVNPLHAFFSKFPVSEVPALAFSAIGFTFAVLYWRGLGLTREWRWLVLAALSFLCLFTTRISGLLYLPFFLTVSTATLLCDPDRARRSALHRWALAVVVLYLSSVLYGLKWSSFYSRDVYRRSFQALLPDHWQAGLLACASVAALGWLAIWIASRSEQRRARLSPVVRLGARLLGPAMALVVILASVKLYQLGFTKRYAGDPLLDGWMKLAGTGWQAVGAGSLVVAAEYLSPLLFVTFVVLALRRWGEQWMPVLLSFLFFFVVHQALLDWWVPYQPYYARYLVGEFVPYALLLVVCAWAYLRPGRTRLAVAAVLLLSGVYAVCLSVQQIGKHENEGAYESLAPLAARLGRRDLLLIDDANVRGFYTSELKTPLLYTFGLPVADASAASLADLSYLGALRGSFDEVYLVSCASTPPSGFLPLGSYRFWTMAFEQYYFPPTNVYTRIDSRLYLYRLEQRLGKLPRDRAEAP